MEEKLRKKRIRTIALIVLAVVIIGAVIVGLNFEFADYGKALDKKVSKAETLIKDADIGNEEGQYAEYTVLEFKSRVDEAKKIAEDEKAEYERQKKAYDTLKEQISEFKDADNDNVLSAKEIKTLSSEKKTVTKETKLSKDKKVTWKIDGSKITKAKAINLDAKLEGPYNDAINTYMEGLKLQGQTISLYHDGDIGGAVSIATPISSKTDTTGYVYEYDSENDTLTYKEEAAVKVAEGRADDSEDAIATFDVTEGGDYIILLEKITDESGKPLDSVDKTAAGEIENSSSSKGGTSSSGGSSDSDNSGSTQPEPNLITVTITIQNNTWSGHRSSILSTTTYQCEKGSTVYDVLYTVCRNKGIQMESSYTPAYGSYYVSGIDNLYEFDGGSGSGWNYLVNGWKPNYGASSYPLNGGENIVWAYTCDYGNDV